MAARENGYCTSFILMSAQLDWEGIEGMSHFPRSISLWGRGGREGVRVEGRFSGRVGRLRSISASRGYWGYWCVGHLCLQGLLGHFLGFLFPHLAVHEAGDEGSDHKDA